MRNCLNPKRKKQRQSPPKNITLVPSVCAIVFYTILIVLPSKQEQPDCAGIDGSTISETLGETRMKEDSLSRKATPTHHDDLRLLLHSVRDHVHHVHCVALAGHPQRTEPDNHPDWFRYITNSSDNTDDVETKKFERVCAHRPARTAVCTAADPCPRRGLELGPGCVLEAYSRKNAQKRHDTSFRNAWQVLSEWGTGNSI